MRLLGDRILCKPIEVKQEKTEGLILPASMVEQNQFEVVLVGPKVKYLKIGNIVRKFLNSDGECIVFKGFEYICLVESKDVDLVLLV